MHIFVESMNYFYLSFNLQIDKVLLIGGSTRLLLVDNILKTFKLHEKLETASVKTDEMVVLGAGVLAYKNFFQQDKKVRLDKLACLYGYRLCPLFST